MKVKYEGGQVLTDVVPDLKKTKFSLMGIIFFIFLRGKRRSFRYRVHHSGFRSGSDARSADRHTAYVGAAYGALCIGADKPGAGRLGSLCMDEDGIR